MKEKFTLTSSSVHSGIDLDFILNHFEEPLFPRTISTKTTEGRQLIANNRNEALARFKQANFIDARINSFPYYIEHRGRNIQKSNFIFIDLDKNRFNSKSSLTRALNETLQKIKEKLNGFPTVLFTGNGYHIYQPLDGIVLEQYDDFNGFPDVSQQFLRFASKYLTNGKSDPNNYPSLRSCLLRVPGSINSKCPRTQVKIIQRWNGFRPHIKLMMGGFHAYLMSMRLKKTKRVPLHEAIASGNCEQSARSIRWIEILLETPIEDYRKNTIALILAPYLISIKKMTHEDAYLQINHWLNKCNSLRRLDSPFDYKVRYSLNKASRISQLPLRFDTLKEKNKRLHDAIQQIIILQND